MFNYLNYNDKLLPINDAIAARVGALHLKQNDECAVQRSRELTRHQQPVIRNPLTALHKLGRL